MKCALILCAAGTLALPSCGQQTWGVLIGGHSFRGGASFSIDDRGIRDPQTFSMGLISSGGADGTSHWTGTLVWQRRSYGYSGWLAHPHGEYWGDLEVRLHLLELTFAGPIGLSERGYCTFDIEPVIDWRFAQELNGVAYTTYARTNDTLIYDHGRAVDRTFSGARMRIGLSGDVPVADRIWLHWAGRFGWGADEWVSGIVLTSWDWSIRVGMIRYFGSRAIATHRRA